MKNNQDIEALRLRAFVPPRGSLLTDLTKTKLPNVKSRFFRLFQAIKESKNRYLPFQEGFDLYKNNPSDSPATLSSLMGRPWREFVLQAAVHVGYCNLRCSYCFVDHLHLTGADSFPAQAEQVVDDFVRLRNKAPANCLNVIKVSGGEPFLVPEFIGGILDELRHLGFGSAVAVKVDTNLTAIQLFRGASAMEALKGHQNLIIHTTIHGATEAAFLRTTGTIKGFSLQFEGLQILESLGLRYVVGIGSNTHTSDELESVFFRLMALDASVISKTHLRAFNFGYASPKRRKSDEMQVASHEESVRTWDRLMKTHLGRGYLSETRVPYAD